MAMGIPLICNAGVGDTDQIVENYKAGIVLHELNEASYSNITDPSFAFDRVSTIKGAKEFYGLEEGVKRYLKVYNGMI